MTKRSLTVKKLQPERMGTKDGTLRERLDHYSIPITECGCHIWIGGIEAKGYGMLNIGSGKIEYAHRLSWQAKNGSIPDGIWVLHKCDMRACINPDHLFLGTRQDNIDDCVAKGRNHIARGEDANRAVLTEKQVRTIRSEQGTHRWLAKKYGVAHCTIGQIKRREIWKHLP